MLVLVLVLVQWISLILAIVAACSPWWSWGYITGQTTGGSQPTWYGASASASPFIAGTVWSTVQTGWCYYCWQTISTFPLYWSSLTQSSLTNSICANRSALNPVYSCWAEPNGYCQTNGNGETNFVAPSNPFNIQGLIISANVFVFIAAVAGCVDASSDVASRPVAIVATFTSFLSMCLLCSSFSLWSTFGWVQNTLSSGAYCMPLWSNPSTASLWALPVTMVYGPGFGCAVAAFCLTLIASFVHLGSIVFDKFESDEDFPNQPKDAAGGDAPAPGASVVRV